MSRANWEAHLGKKTRKVGTKSGRVIRKQAGFDFYIPPRHRLHTLKYAGDAEPLYFFALFLLSPSSPRFTLFKQVAHGFYLHYRLKEVLRVFAHALQKMAI